MLKGTASSPSDDTSRVLAEARKHAQLVHTNIVQVYDVIDCEGEHLIVMEYVDGPSLEDLMRDCARINQPPPLDTAISILRDVLAGVSFAHAKNIVHRDLSPSNILLTGTSIPKVADFGIATILKPTGSDGRDASVHGPTGNKLYMSPEQQRGEEVDQLSDLFMVGIIGYLLLTGRHPFAHPSGLFSIPELISAEDFVPDPPRPASNLTASQQRLHREYSAVIMRLLNRERAGRFASAREAILALEAVTPFQECGKCGERLPEHFRFCGYCGESTEAASAPAIKLRLPGEFALTAEEWMHDGYVLSREGKWQDAIIRYEQAMALDPNNQRALRNIGFILNGVGRFEDADKILTKGLDLGNLLPAHEAGFLYDRAYARAQLKNYDEALADVNRALELQPTVKAQYLRARIHVYIGSLIEAKRDAQEVLSRVSDHVGALRLLDQISRVATEGERTH